MVSSFTAAEPLCNNLPLHPRDSQLTLLQFRSLLKMHLFDEESSAWLLLLIDRVLNYVHMAVFTSAKSARCIKILRPGARVFGQPLLVSS